MEVSGSLAGLNRSGMLSPQAGLEESPLPAREFSSDPCLLVGEFTPAEKKSEQIFLTHLKYPAVLDYPALQGLSNCQRIRQLRNRNASLSPSAMLMACRNASAADRRRGWGGRPAHVDRAPKEKLPRIQMGARNKFDCLFGGGSASDATVRPCQRYVDGHILGNRKENDRADAEKPKQKKSLVRALQQANLAAALDQWKSGNKDSAAVKGAKAVFEMLAMHSERITPEMLREHFLLTTPSGVAPYEAFDFLSEACDQRESLSFEDFLCYGEKLRERMFAYEQFAPLNDKNKLMVVAERVLLGDVPTSLSEARRLLMEALKNQEVGRMTGKFRPMRIYELLFLMDLERRLSRREGLHPPRDANKTPGNACHQKLSVPPRRVTRTRGLFDNTPGTRGEGAGDGEGSRNA